MKKIVIISGAFALTAFIATIWPAIPHLKDFLDLLVWIGLLTFIPSLFLLRADRVSTRPTRVRLFKGLRLAVLASILLLITAALLPRTYDVLPMPERAGIQYWDLSTGSRIAYLYIPGKGNRRPEPIIYLHGGPGARFSDGNISNLSPLSEEGYDVYLYDQVGGGLSARLADIREYTADRHRRDLEAIVRRIGARQVILVGQSWGAILAALFLADNPGKVSKMILTGPGPIMPMRRELQAIKAPDSLHLRAPYYSNGQGNAEASNIRSRLMRFVALCCGRKLASDREADAFESYQNQLVNRSTVWDTSELHPRKARGGDGFYANLMTAASFGRVADPRPKLKNSRVPLLVMKGQGDNQAWGFTREYLDIFVDHRLVIIPEAGHGLEFEKPALYIKTIKAFLQE